MTLVYLLTSSALLCGIQGRDQVLQRTYYYLTFATCCNLILETKSGHNPVFIGPAILHKSKLERSYDVLPSEMVQCHPSCAGVLVVGTDGKVNLSNPLLNVFQSAMHLRCDVHKKTISRANCLLWGFRRSWEKNTWQTFSARMKLNLIVVFKT